MFFYSANCSSKRQNVASIISGSASVLAIAVAMSAMLTSPATASSCTNGANAHWTGTCLGPALPTGGTFTNSGTINSGTINGATGVKVYSVPTLTTLTNLGVISVTGVGINIIGSSIGTLDNSLTLQGTPTGLYNDNYSTIGTLTNSGSIGGATAIFNEGSILHLTNNDGGNIIGPGYGIYNDGGFIGTLTNNFGGTISANSYTAIYNYDGVIGTLSNNGAIIGGSRTITTLASVIITDLQGIHNSGSITRLINNGTISAGTGVITGAASIPAGTNDFINMYGLHNSGGVGTLSNSGTISGGAGTISGGSYNTIKMYGLNNSGSISTLSNSDTISGGGGIITGGSYNTIKMYGLNNSGAVGTLSNNGTISGGTGTINLSGHNNIYMYGIANTGTITTLSNTTLINSGKGTLNQVPGNDIYAWGIYNEGLISNLTNSGTISASVAQQGESNGIYNSGTIGSLFNEGSIGGESIDGFASNMGISNDGLIFALTNGANGTIHGFGNTGTINTVTNDLGGTIESGFFNSGSVYIFTNAGLISSTIPAVINSGTIDTLTNSGSIISSLMGVMNVFGKIKTLSNSGNIIGSIAGLTNMGGTIGTLTNAVGGVIGGVLSVAISNSADGIIGTLSNSGSIGGGGITGILNTGTILTLTNHDTGTITGAHTGIVNGSSTISGWIGTLTNLGVVSGGTLGTPAIDNSYGTIGTLINAQGGNGTIGTGTLGALTYTGNLPGTYLEYVTSPTHYGQLFVSGGSGTMFFDIAPGSHLNAGTYFNVLELGTFGSIASEVSGTVTGTYNGVTWYLVDPPGTYNLIVPISDTNTRRQLEANRDQVLSAMRARAAVATNALGYDCATFDKNGVCIAFNARYSSLDSVNDGGGVLTGAYRLNETTRIGAFIDYSVAQDGLSSVKFGEDMPTFGGFMAYAQKPDGTGVQARLAASYNTGRATITRDDSLYDGTEAGSGKANLTTYAIGGELGYGFALAKDVLATPYAGLRYTDSTRGAYSETTSEAVADPISYNAYVQRLTTATLGVRFNGALTDKLSYQIGLGGEYDLSSVANAYSGTSAISGLEAFALANTASANRLRGNGSVGLAYITAPNQKLSASVSVRGEAYTAKPSTNVLMGYQVGF